MSPGFIKISVYFALVALAAAVAVWLAGAPGSVAVTWLGWRMDTSVPVALVLVALLVGIVWWLLSTGHRLRSARDRFVASRQEARRMRGLEALGDGFAAVHAHDGRMAERCARDAASLLGDTSATRLLTEQAAVLTGNTEQLDRETQRLLERPETELAARRDLAERAKAEGNWDQVAVNAAHAASRKPAPDWAQRLLVEAAVARGRWRDAQGPLTDRMADRTFGADQAQAMRAAILTAEAEQAYVEKRYGDVIVAAKKALDLAPDTVLAASLLAKAHSAEGKPKKAAQTLERAWTFNPDPVLLAEYRNLMPGESAIDWVKRIEALVKSAPMTPVTRVALAEAAFDADLWGKAQSYIEPLINESKPSSEKARACRLAARIAQAEAAGPRDVVVLMEKALDAADEVEAGRQTPVSAAVLLERVGLTPPVKTVKNG